MKLGICLGCKSYDNFKIVSNYGYDYVEINFSELANMEELDYLEMLKNINNLNISCEAANGFIPSDIKITGDKVNYEKINEFLNVGLIRAEKLGIKTVVFGSGCARQVPEGFSKEKAYQQLIIFLRNYVACPAKIRGITIVIEPLRTRECNIIHTVQEGVALALDCCCDNVKGLADIYHMVCNNDSIHTMSNLKNQILHAHISNGISRKFPKQDDGFDYKSFINILKDINCERCSIEGIFDNFPVDALESFNYLKSLI